MGKYRILGWRPAIEGIGTPLRLICLSQLVFVDGELRRGRVYQTWSHPFYEPDGIGFKRSAE
jgi:hypothetical protein